MKIVHKIQLKIKGKVVIKWKTIMIKAKSKVSNSIKTQLKIRLLNRQIIKNFMSNNFVKFKAKVEAVVLRKFEN